MNYGSSSTDSGLEGVVKIQIDQRLLLPGWGGELAPDELDFLQAELGKDKKLGYQWGFKPRAKRRPEWAIHQVATLGDPDMRAVNMGLARRQLPPNLECNDSNHAQTQ